MSAKSPEIPQAENSPKPPDISPLEALRAAVDDAAKKGFSRLGAFVGGNNVAPGALDRAKVPATLRDKFDAGMKTIMTKLEVLRTDFQKNIGALRTESTRPIDLVNNEPVETKRVEVVSNRTESPLDAASRKVIEATLALKRAAPDSDKTKLEAALALAKSEELGEIAVQRSLETDVVDMTGPDDVDLGEPEAERGPAVADATPEEDLESIDLDDDEAELDELELDKPEPDDTPTVILSRPQKKAGREFIPDEDETPPSLKTERLPADAQAEWKATADTKVDGLVAEMSKSGKTQEETTKRLAEVKESLNSVWDDDKRDKLQMEFAALNRYGKLIYKPKENAPSQPKKIAA